MKVLLFAQARQAADCSEYLLEITRPLSQPEFWTLLVKQFPALASLQKSARLARNETYPDPAELLRVATTSAGLGID